MGEGYHHGSEVVSKSADVDAAMQAAEQKMRERYSGQMLLPEELPDIERNIQFAKNAVRQWAENYDKADFRVLWPEVSGCVPIPNTEHHCFFAHRLLYPDVPYDQCIDGLNRVGFETFVQLPRKLCVQPHHFKFRTDGIIEMYKKVWLLEQKTTSSTARNNFWPKWNMEFQTRGYCYGVWKTTGVQVAGFLLNAVIKHSKQVTVNGQKKMQIDPTNVGFEREPFLVNEQDMLDFEHDFVGLANEYEAAFADKAQNDKSFKIFKNTDNCFDYNRACYYLELCKRGHEKREGEFRERNPDYVELEYYNLLGIKPPSNLPESTVLSNNPTEGMVGE